jgi:hypothetical protein
MKLPKTITLLSILVAAIITLWVLPRVNQAKTTTYTRVYEDTFQPSSRMATVDTSKVRHDKQPKKAFRKEHIKPKEGWRKVRPEMFSRATHFLEAPLVLVDSMHITPDSVLTNVSLDTTLLELDL